MIRAFKSHPPNPAAWQCRRHGGSQRALVYAPCQSRRTEIIAGLRRLERTQRLIVHSTNTMETQRGAIENGVITASDRLFVRNNLPAPPASVTDNPDVWEVQIEGVKNPRT